MSTVITEARLPLYLFSAPNSKLKHAYSMVRSTETNLTRNTRRAVTFAVAVFVLLLGVPLFFHTTAIYRAELPIDEFKSKVDDFATTAHLKVPVFIETDLQIETLQNAINEKVQQKWNLGDLWNLDLVPEPSSASIYHVKVSTAAHTACSASLDSLTVDITADEKSPYDSAADLLLSNVFKDELDSLDVILHPAAHKHHPNHTLTLPYSSTYNVVFNLFVENGQSVDWEIDDALASISPLMDALSHYTQFKVSTQIQYYTKLHNTPVYDESSQSYIIPKSDLSTFVDYGEWNLITHDVHRSINFLLFFPATNFDSKPLYVEGSQTNSFLIPQWGGVYIYNLPMPVLRNMPHILRADRLLPVFDVFASQLLELLGVPRHPKSPLFRLESFNRIMAVKNLGLLLDNLSSLVALSNSLSGISIPELTKSHMSDSLRYFDAAVQSLRDFKFADAVEQSAKGVESSDKAFFDKEMVQQAYFPNEHKLAVFLPLLGPLASIILIGILKTFKEIRKEKDDQKRAMEEKKLL